MMHRFLNSRGTVACLLAMVTGMTLYFRMPFPEDNVLFELMYLRASPIFWGLKHTYILLLYTTPFIGYSIFWYWIALLRAKRIAIVRTVLRAYSAAVDDFAEADGYQTQTNQFACGAGNWYQVASTQSKIVRPTANRPVGVGRVISVRCSIQSRARMIPIPVKPRPANTEKAFN